MAALGHDFTIYIYIYIYYTAQHKSKLLKDATYHKSSLKDINFTINAIYSLYALYTLYALYARLT